MEGLSRGGRVSTAELAQRRKLGGEKWTVQKVGFHGHPLVRALHPRTIEITTEEHLSEQGDCIVGVGADVGCSGLSREMKEGLRARDALVLLRLIVGEDEFKVGATGDPRLTLSHDTDMVIRRSTFVSDRTLAVNADSTAAQIPRRMVAALKNEGTRGLLEIAVRRP